MGGTEAAAEVGSTRERFDVSDICLIGSWVRVETEAKERVITFDANHFVVFGCERRSGKREARGIIRGRVEGIEFGMNGEVLVGTLEVTNVGWKFLRWEIVHTFIKACMKGNFDTIGVRIIP